MQRRKKSWQLRKIGRKLGTQRLRTLLSHSMRFHMRSKSNGKRRISTESSKITTDSSSETTKSTNYSKKEPKSRS